jgi:hypothetical protein
LPRRETLKEKSGKPGGNNADLSSPTTKCARRSRTAARHIERPASTTPEWPEAPGRRASFERTDGFVASVRRIILVVILILILILIVILILVVIVIILVIISMSMSSATSDERTGRRTTGRSGGGGGSSYAYDEDTIIVELGQVWIKCGFGGEAAPRHVYRNAYDRRWDSVRRGEGATIRTSLYRCFHDMFTQ